MTVPSACQGCNTPSTTEIGGSGHETISLAGVSPEGANTVVVKLRGGGATTILCIVFLDILYNICWRGNLIVQQ